MFEKFNDSIREQQQVPKQSLITRGFVNGGDTLKSPQAYTQPFCDFLTENPTIWHAIVYFEKKLQGAGFKKVRLVHFTSLQFTDDLCTVVGTPDLEPRARTRREILYH